MALICDLAPSWLKITLRISDLCCKPAHLGIYQPLKTKTKSLVNPCPSPRLAGCWGYQNGAPSSGLARLVRAPPGSGLSRAGCAALALTERPHSELLRGVGSGASAPPRTAISAFYSPSSDQICLLLQNEGLRRSPSFAKNIPVAGSKGRDKRGGCNDLSVPDSSGLGEMEAFSLELHSALAGAGCVRMGGTFHRLMELERNLEEPPGATAPPEGFQAHALGSESPEHF